MECEHTEYCHRVNAKHVNNICKKLRIANHSKPELYVIVYPQRKRTPLLAIEYAYREAQQMDGLQLMFCVPCKSCRVADVGGVDDWADAEIPLLRAGCNLRIIQL